VRPSVELRAADEPHDGHDEGGIATATRRNGAVATPRHGNGIGSAAMRRRIAIMATSAAVTAIRCGVEVTAASASRTVAIEQPSRPRSRLDGDEPVPDEVPRRPRPSRPDTPTQPRSVRRRHDGARPRGASIRRPRAHLITARRSSMRRASDTWAGAGERPRRLPTERHAERVVPSTGNDGPSPSSCGVGAPDARLVV
jgi:hypothetical protein